MSLPCHLAFDVHEASQVGEARRAAVRLAESLGFDEVAAGRVALVATELGTNLVRHAERGQLLLAPVTADDGDAWVELLSLDHGPGIADLPACMRDGYSTGGTPGNGLGAVRRLADEFDMYSEVPAGTVILARVARHAGAARPAPAFSVGAVALAAPGETVSGDAWGLVQDGEQAALLVADGLGHGPEAGTAAEAAVAAFGSGPFEAPSRVLERVHQALRSTRGAAVALVHVDAGQKSLIHCGAGNIAGRLISGVEDRSLVSQHGTAGLQIRRLQDLRYDWPEHTLIVLHSDGITTRWNLDNSKGLLQRHPALVAAWLMRDQRRGRDDATVVVLKRGSPR
ncbi:ATP-binding protein/SpoIIE family protein phosphatase [Aquabacterium sp. A7-Y]|uniref:ATP-binding SpoIIE family protein phosphatase n=1 Tax=Aquabacterium sp. A7-Y TaxID=1349605 RepID=UPI00223CF538|nr:ATP-binding SpoIIE family protein phosphatase [Aquabacterium sp. A7-Y]MCW7538060.1 ATP-binding protein/SpoIIE family protein phosphatase [Aquabacterium sp. A7-Y]